MTRLILAAVAAFALTSAAPALACPDCHDCPMHKDKVASAEKTDKKEAKKCSCGATDPKDCKCGGKCDCHTKKAEKKDEKKS